MSGRDWDCPQCGCLICQCESEPRQQGPEGIVVDDVARLEIAAEQALIELVKGDPDEAYHKLFWALHPNGRDRVRLTRIEDGAA